MSLNRKMERNRLKEDYKKFCKTWNMMKQLESDLGRQYKMAKKPSYAEWLEKVKEIKTRQVEKKEPEVIDTEWEE